MAKQIIPEMAEESGPGSPKKYYVALQIIGMPKGLIFQMRMPVAKIHEIQKYQVLDIPAGRLHQTPEKPGPGCSGRCRSFGPLLMDEIPMAKVHEIQKDRVDDIPAGRLHQTPEKPGQGYSSRCWSFEPLVMEEMPMVKVHGIHEDQVDDIPAGRLHQTPEKPGQGCSSRCWSFEPLVMDEMPMAKVHEIHKDWVLDIPAGRLCQIPEERGQGFFNLAKASKVFLVLTGQAGVSLIAYAPKFSSASNTTGSLNAIVSANALSFVCCLMCVWLDGKKPVASRIMGIIGCLSFVLAFFLMVSVFV